MLLRDQLACQAMVGLLASPVTPDDRGGAVFWGKRLGWNHRDVPTWLAQMAYQLADAMLAACRAGRPVCDGCEQPKTLYDDSRPGDPTCWVCVDCDGFGPVEGCRHEPEPAAAE